MELPQSYGDTENKMDLPESQRDTGLSELSVITERIIGCAIEVHRVLGPGLLEQIYETAMCIEMDDVGLTYARQVRIAAAYKGRLLGEYRIDLIVNDRVVVEIKSVERMNPVFEAQLLNYMRLSAKRVGLLINFNTRLVKDGVTRRVL